MIFRSERALKFLMDRGVVYTFRIRRRKRTGKDWVTDRFGGKKIADVIVDELAYIEDTAKALIFFVNKSGFDTTQEWIGEIIRINGYLPKEGWIYRVTRLAEEEPDCFGHYPVGEDCETCEWINECIDWSIEDEEEESE